MIPFALIILGGFLIGQSRQDQKFSKGGQITSKEWDEKSSADKKAYLKKYGEVYVGGVYYVLIQGRLAEIGTEDDYSQNPPWYGVLLDFYDASYDDGEWQTVGYVIGSDKEDVTEKLEEEYKRLTK